MTMEYVTFEELFEAYVDCRKRKRRTESCSRFEMAAMSNIEILLDDLNSQAYEIGYSICFVVTRPKLREVYAADFRDRIVHHLIIRKFNHLFENYFIDSTYNCRVGKGVLYGARDWQCKIDKLTEHNQREAWIWKADLKNFFMTIDKKILYEMLESFLRRLYHGDDLDWWLWLIRKVAMHEPQKLCHYKGNPELLKSLEPGKSLSTNKPGCGLAIGNLTSQIFANLYLSALDYYISGFEGVYYGRYVDDFGVACLNKNFLLWLMPQVRRFLSQFGVELHQKKWILQQACKGIKFTGYVIKRGRLYMGNRTVNNAFGVASKGHQDDIETFVSRMNSYLGFIQHTQSYAIRRNLWKVIPEETKHYIYITNRFKKIVLKRKYRYEQSKNAY